MHREDCSSPGPSAPLAPWRMARRLDRPAPARITSRVRYRQTSAERIADGNRSDFCSTSPRTAPWCIALILHESVIRGPRSQIFPGAGLPINPRSGHEVHVGSSGYTVVDELLLQSVSYRCMTGAHTTDCTYSPFPVQHPSEDEGRRRGHPMIRLGLNDPC